jgi:hypothetical protein
MLMSIAMVYSATPASADHEVCVPIDQAGQVVCTIVHDPPPTDGGTHHGGNPGHQGGDTGCYLALSHQAVPCSAKGGYWSNGRQCYVSLMNPQPPAGDPLWAGHKTGAFYHCMGPGPDVLGSIFWSANPPPGMVVLPPAAVLAQRAAARLQLPHLGAASNGGASQTTYVGVPTWLWVDSAGWVPKSATAAVGTRSVTVTATPVNVAWDMGDGSSGVTCPGPGVPFNSADPMHPPCGYTYQKSSIGQSQQGPSPNDRFFHVQGQVTFTLHWVCQGNCDQPAGDLADMPWPTTAMPLRVFEVQTVNVGH